MIVKEGFDGALRYGNRINADMVAVQVASPSKAGLAAASSCLEDSGVPTAPGDLLDHRAVACRSQATGASIPWTLRSGTEAVQIVLPQATIVHDLAVQTDLAVRDQEVLRAPVAMRSDLIKDGRLCRVLPDWFSPEDALYFYLPSRRHQSAALRALQHS
jgi:DNA-binding transcriptional LysR family regulator